MKAGYDLDASGACVRLQNKADRIQVYAIVIIVIVIFLIILAIILAVFFVCRCNTMNEIMIKSVKSTHVTPSYRYEPIFKSR